MHVVCASAVHVKHRRNKPDFLYVIMIIIIYNNNILYSATSIIRKSMTSIIRKIRHFHWVLGRLSVYLAVSCLNQWVLGKLSVYLAVSCLNWFRQLTAKYSDSFPNAQCNRGGTVVAYGGDQ